LSDEDRVKELTAAIGELSEAQRFWIESVVAQFRRPHSFKRLESSDIVTAGVLNDFGDSLRIHHCFSKEALSKDRFEYAFERILKKCGVAADLAPRGNPGHDITINNQRVSLKTQANAGIRDDQIWISKFMEMGRGDWTDKDSDLIGLRERFFNHMRSYDRIFTLRMLTKSGKSWRYELVEIPKALLLEAQNGKLVMMHDSRQMPRPGYCHVTDQYGASKFDLYFDGGTERKLQIKGLNKALCTVHATWTFEAG